MKNIRSQAFVAVYLMLQKDDQILMLLRKNTGYCDGQYSLVAGHVDEGESATAAMIREAKEEANIEIRADQIRVVHVMHRRADRLNVDIFYECKNWQGAIFNREPDKCAELKFFPLDRLPVNAIEYVSQAIRRAAEGKHFSELGWP